MRFIHFSDSHLGDHLPHSPGNDPETLRGKDFFKNFFLVTDYIVKHAKNLDFIIHTGDLFDSEPTHYVQELAIKPLKEIDDLGIPIFLLKGNHEKTCFPDSFTSRFKNLYVFCEPWSKIIRVKGKKVLITGIPYVKEKKIRTDKLFKESLKESQWEKRKADLKIIMIHQLLHGAKVGPIGYRFGRHSDVLSKEAIPSDFDYIAVGHIHRKQILRHPKTKKRNIIFPGSQERITFSEINEKKGFYDVSVDKNGVFSAEFKPLSCRPMFEYKFRINSKSEKKTLDEAYKLLRKIPNNGYGKIRFEGKITRELFDRLPLERFKKKSFKCHFNFKQLKIYEGHNSVFMVKDTDLKGDTGLILDLQLTASKVKALPRDPGIYILKDEKKLALYIGRGKNIQSSVKAHIKRAVDNPHRKELLERTKFVDCRAENNLLNMIFEQRRLLRKYSPQYNKKVSSPHDYSYIVTEKSDGLNFLSLSQDAGGDPSYFLGPLKQDFSLERVMLTLENMLDLPTCRGHFYENPKLCIKFLTKNCIAPCKSKDRIRRYEKHLNEVFTYPLKVINKLKKRVQRTGNPLRLKYLESLEKQLTELDRIYSMTGIFRSPDFKGPGSGIIIIRNGRILRTERIRSDKHLDSRMKFFRKLIAESGVIAPLKVDQFLNARALLELIEKKKLEIIE